MFGQNHILNLPVILHTCLNFKLLDSVDEDNSASSVCEIDKLLKMIKKVAPKSKL